MDNIYRIPEVSQEFDRIKIRFGKDDGFIAYPFVWAIGRGVFSEYYPDGCIVEATSDGFVFRIELENSDG